MKKYFLPIAIGVLAFFYWQKKRNDAQAPATKVSTDSLATTAELATATLFNKVGITGLTANSNYNTALAQQNGQTYQTQMHNAGMIY